MKIILLLLFLPIIALSQNNKNTVLGNFSIQDRIIYWEKIYELESGQKIQDLRNKLKLKFETDSTGTANNLECNCRGFLSDVQNPFNAVFAIYSKQGKYKVRVSDIIFITNLEINMDIISNSGGGIKTLESFAIRNNAPEFRKNKRLATDLECIDNYLSSLFTINTQKDW